MRVFLIAINTGSDVYSKAQAIINQAGHESYSSAEEFSIDGVQDPSRAVDETEAIVWITDLTQTSSMTPSDYSPLYGDSVLRQAINSLKPVLFYALTVGDNSRLLPPILKRITRSHTLQSLDELEEKLCTDLNDLHSGLIPLSPRLSW